MVPPRFDVTEDQITQVVVQFYALVRSHQTLGPIFASHVTDWPTHEAKIVRFWCNAILSTRTYDGNPMQAHMAAGNVRPAHFAVWLGLFDSVLGQVLPTQTAQAWSDLAHRIGRGLQFGLTSTDTATGVPILT